MGLGITYLGLRPKPPASPSGGPSPRAGLAGPRRARPVRHHTVELCSARLASGRISADRAVAVVLFRPRREPDQRDVGVFVPRMDGHELAVHRLPVEDRGAVERSRAEHLQKVQVVAGQSRDDVRRAERADHLGGCFLRVDGLEAEGQLRRVEVRLRRAVGPRPGRYQRERAIEAARIREPIALRASALDREAAHAAPGQHYPRRDLPST